MEVCGQLHAPAASPPRTAARPPHRIPARGGGLRAILYAVMIFFFFKAVLIILIRFAIALLTTVGDPPLWPRDSPLSTKVGTKFRRQVAVAQSV
jgi:hypothetical protein